MDNGSSVKQDLINSSLNVSEYEKYKDEYSTLLNNKYLNAGQIDRIKELINLLPELANIKGSNGQTVLHIAAHTKNIVLLRFLSGRRIDDINVTDNDNNTPLHNAIFTGDVNIVAAILKLNPDLSVKNHKGLTPKELVLKHLSESHTPFEKTQFRIIAGILGDAVKKTDQIYIPKIIHFIWAGGQHEMPKPSIEVVSKWARQNAGFEIFLWVDSKTFGKKGTDEERLVQIAKMYFEKFKQYLGNDTKICYKLACYGNTTGTAKIVIKDIEEEKISDECIRYEID